MKYNILYLTKFLFLFAGLISCSNDEELPPSGNGAEQEINFTLNLPGLNIPKQSKALAESEEYNIATIDILVFDIDADNKETFAYHRPVTSAITQSGNNGQDVSFRVWLKRKWKQNVVVVANARSVLNTIIPSTSVGAAKADILKRLIFSQPGKWPTDPMGLSIDMPMYGESGIIDIHSIANTNPPITLQLIRMLARIDVSNKASNFELQSVYLCNSNASGYVSPEWSTGGNILWGQTTANVPPLLTKQLPLLYNTNNGMLERDIYTFESARADDNNGHDSEDRKRAACLILKGIYEGRTYYYRVDFTFEEPSATDPSGREYMPLLRNHKYEVDITKAEGIGYATLQEAIDSYSVSSNLKTRVLWYDEARAKDVNYNGQYMLAFSDDSHLVKANGESISTVVTTDYPKGWEIDSDNGIYNADGSSATSWISVDTYSGITGTTPMNITVSPMPQEVEARVGYIEVTSGRMKADIEIIQYRYSLQALSNCYLISPGATTPLVIPIRRAEQAVWGSLRRRANYSGDFLWTDNKNGISQLGCVQRATIYGKSRKAIMMVEAGSGHGNTVISVADDGQIKWSWHIWTTDYTPSGTMMDRNLGAINNAASAWWESRGVFYQWGRKDPFPNMYTKKTIPNPQYPEESNIPTIDITPAFYYDHNGNQVEVSFTNNANSTFIQHPNIFSSSDLWTGSGGTNSWGINGSKTIYDPCPSGWRIPHDSIWKEVDELNFITNSTVWNENSSAIDYGAAYTAGRLDIASGSNAFYPGGGGCFYDSIASRVVINDVAVAGYYWSKTASEDNKAEMLRFTAALPKDENSISSRNNAFSVRCIRE